MTERMLEPRLYEKPPEVCPKEDCDGSFFLPHEDGWQCFNCMKIIYKATNASVNKPVVKKYQHEKSLAYSDKKEAS